MKWHAELVKYRLCWWLDFHDYGLGGKIDPVTHVRKRVRRSADAPFVPQALDNAFFQEAFGILTELEQKFLVELYMDNGIDVSLVDVWKLVEVEPGVWEEVKVEDEIRIEVPMDAWEAVARKSNIDPFDMQKIADKAVARMVNYLNEEEGD